MRTVQITVDDETLRHVDCAAKRVGLRRSEIVRQALRQWLRHRAAESFERDWISALGSRPDEAAHAEDWLASQPWNTR